MKHITTARDAMRLIAATSSVLMAMGAGSAFAQIDINNTGTGQNSDNKSTVNLHDNTDVDFTNTNDLLNSLYADVDTGHNKAKNNTIFDGSLHSGDATGDVSFDTTVDNSGSGGGLSINPLDLTANLSNGITGQNSNNKNKLNVHNNVNVSQDNTNTVTNAVSLDLKTGHNKVQNNTEANGSLVSGDADARVNLSTDINNGGGVDLGNLTNNNIDVTSSNHITGQNSNNENTTNIHHDVDVSVVNDNTVTNAVSVSEDTGHNSVEGNTIAGGLHSGNAGVSVTGTTNISN